MHILRSSIAALAAFLLLTFGALADDGHLTIATAKGDHAFNIEVVDTPEGRAKGLMFRHRTRARCRHAVRFPRKPPGQLLDAEHPDPARYAVHPARRDHRQHSGQRQPLDPTSIPSDGPVEFVFEIAGGRSVELGIKAGDTVIQDRVNKDR